MNFNRYYFFRAVNIIEKTIILWVSTLGIFVLLIGSGFMDISSNVDVLFLQPVYAIYRQSIENYYKDHENPVLRDLTDELFGEAEVVIVNFPEYLEDSLSMEIYTRNMTDGDSIYKYLEIIQYDQQIKELMLEPDYGELYKTHDMNYLYLSNEDKRKLFSMGFSYLLKGEFERGSKRIGEDTLARLFAKYPRFKEKPTFTISSIFYSRKVFSILTVENNSDNDIYDIFIAISKNRLSDAKGEHLKLELWSYNANQLNCLKNSESEIRVQIPRLSSKSSVELIVSNWWSNINSDDVVISYNKLRSLNIRYVKYIFWSSLLFSLIISVLIVLLKPEENIDR